MRTLHYNTYTYSLWSHDWVEKLVPSSSWSSSSSAFGLKEERTCKCLFVSKRLFKCTHVCETWFQRPKNRPPGCSKEAMVISGGTRRNMMVVRPSWLGPQRLTGRQTVLCVVVWLWTAIKAFAGTAVRLGEGVTRGWSPQDTCEGCTNDVWEAIIDGWHKNRPSVPPQASHHTAHDSTSCSWFLKDLDFCTLRRSWSDVWKATFTSTQKPTKPSAPFDPETFQTAPFWVRHRWTPPTGRGPVRFRIRVFWWSCLRPNSCTGSDAFRREGRWVSVSHGGAHLWRSEVGVVNLESGCW